MERSRQIEAAAPSLDVTAHFTALGRGRLAQARDGARPARIRQAQRAARLPARGHRRYRRRLIFAGPWPGQAAQGGTMTRTRLSRATWLLIAGDACSALGTGLVLPLTLIYLRGLGAISLPRGRRADGDHRSRGSVTSRWPVSRLTGSVPAPRACLPSCAARPWRKRPALPGRTNVGTGELQACSCSGHRSARRSRRSRTILAGIDSEPAMQQRAFAINFTGWRRASGVGGAGWHGAAVVDPAVPASFQLLFLANAASCLVFVAILGTLPNVRHAGELPRGARQPSAAHSVARDPGTGLHRLHRARLRAARLRDRRGAGLRARGGAVDHAEHGRDRDIAAVRAATGQAAAPEPGVRGDQPGASHGPSSACRRCRARPGCGSRPCRVQRPVRAGGTSWRRPPRRWSRRTTRWPRQRAGQHGVLDRLRRVACDLHRLDRRWPGRRVDRIALRWLLRHRPARAAARPSAQAGARMLVEAPLAAKARP